MKERKVKGQNGMVYWERRRQREKEMKVLGSWTKLVGTDNFWVEEAFPVGKLLLSIADELPSPHCNAGLLKKTLIMTFSSAFNIAIGFLGNLNSKFPLKNELCHEFCPRL